jgi:hypothetical protein
VCLLPTRAEWSLGPGVLVDIPERERERERERASERERERERENCLKSFKEF